MDKGTKEKALKALERQTKQYKRQNDFIKNNYERIAVTLPKGTKEALRNKGVKSINGLINKLIQQFINEKE